MEESFDILSHLMGRNLELVNENRQVKNINDKLKDIITHLSECVDATCNDPLHIMANDVFNRNQQVHKVLKELDVMISQGDI